jgi:FdhD protein
MNPDDSGHRHDSISVVSGVTRYSVGGRATSTETVAREEPLEIRLAGLSVAVTMRTPGHDFDLISGFLVTEGILPDLSGIDSMAYCPDEGQDGEANIVNVNLRDPAALDPSRWQRNFYASSSCGVCGKASIDAVRSAVEPLAENDDVPLETILQVGKRLSAHQPIFDETGGLHAAALASNDGQIICAREDIGRHNAVDKVVGSMLRNGAAAACESGMLVVSGRASFEIVQKALKARIPVVAAVSAPSSLAVELSREMGLTLVGFLRGDRCNVYAGHNRVRF